MPIEPAPYSEYSDDALLAMSTPELTALAQEAYRCLVREETQKIHFYDARSGFVRQGLRKLHNRVRDEIEQRGAA